MSGETFGAIVVYAFVFFVLGAVLYALVRPFMHLHYDRTGSARLWQHLP